MQYNYNGIYFMVAMVAIEEAVEIQVPVAVLVMVLSQGIDFDLLKMTWDLSVA
jgi:hypothetical protein